MVNHNASPARVQRGTTMIEVLVTIVILTIGLLGLAGLQARLQSSEMEAYQRAQALVLVNDMAGRIATNRANAAGYVTGSTAPLGPTACGTDTATQVDRDLGEWCGALRGASEVSAGGASVGSVIGGRGCVEDLGNNEYLITVAWQGLTPLSAPAPACGRDRYDGAAGSVCTGDVCRRVITTVVRIGNLT